MSEPIRDTELRELESALAALRPAPASVDRDQLLFRAGQRTARGTGRFWRCAAAASSLIAVGLGIVILVRPAPRAQVVYVRVVPEESTGPQADSPGEAPDLGPAVRYFQLRDQLLSRGLDGLPAASPVAPAELPESLDNILGIPGRDLSRRGPRG